ncbi:unnamed protein product [Rangifer tarandus platyrhynchus]|uniref:Uncharacterized protein n=1 Tax=Rangifer tarandus platyrhynchus TaxID=3082113 RepID=A0AC59YR99_RANTA
MASIHTWEHELVSTGRNEHPSTCLASFDMPPTFPHSGRTRVSPYSLVRVDTEDSCVELLGSEGDPNQGSDLCIPLTPVFCRLATLALSL